MPVSPKGSALPISSHGGRTWYRDSKPNSDLECGDPSTPPTDVDTHPDYIQRTVEIKVQHLDRPRRMEELVRS
jgi:hypothetical protein